MEAAGEEWTSTARAVARIQRALETKDVVFIDRDDRPGLGAFV